MPCNKQTIYDKLLLVKYVSSPYCIMTTLLTG